MATWPVKTARFLVGLSVAAEYKEDVLVAFDEGYERVLENEGPAKAQKWALWQARRIIPWGAIAQIAKVAYVIFKVWSEIFKIVP